MLYDGIRAAHSWRAPWILSDERWILLVAGLRAFWILGAMMRSALNGFRTNTLRGCRICTRHHHLQHRGHWCSPQQQLGPRSSFGLMKDVKIANRRRGSISHRWWHLLPCGQGMMIHYTSNSNDSIIAVSWRNSWSNPQQQPRACDRIDIHNGNVAAGSTQRCRICRMLYRRWRLADCCYLEIALRGSAGFLTGGHVAPC